MKIFKFRLFGDFLRNMFSETKPGSDGPWITTTPSKDWIELANRYDGFVIGDSSSQRKMQQKIKIGFSNIFLPWREQLDGPYVLVSVELGVDKSDVPASYGLSFAFRELGVFLSTEDIEKFLNSQDMRHAWVVLCKVKMPAMCISILEKRRAA